MAAKKATQPPPEDIGLHFDTDDDHGLDYDPVIFDMPDPIDGFSLDEAGATTAIGTALVAVRRYPRPRMVTYEHAVDLVKGLPDIREQQAVYAVVSGNFIFGDFIEALMVERNYLAEEILIATLSLGQENVDSLHNLQAGGYVRNLDLIVSDYWYAHERRRQGGVPYIIEHLGGDSNFRFAVAAIHTKVVLIKTACGRRYVLHGSGNLRSSRNLEQLCIENNEALYRFNREWMERLLVNFAVSGKSIRGERAWREVAIPTAPEHGEGRN